MSEQNIVKVTGDEVKAAALAANIKHIPHHDCGICGENVHYRVDDEGNLFFHSACGCSWSPAQPRPWQDAADWINMQSKPEWHNKLRVLFGLPTI